MSRRSRIQADFGVPSGEPFGDTLDIQTPVDPTSFHPTLLDTNTPVIPGAILTPQQAPYGYAPTYTRPASPTPLYSTELAASGIFGPPVDPEYPIESPAQSLTPATPVRRYRSVSLPTVLYTTGTDDQYGTDEPIPGLLTPAGQGLKRWQPVGAAPIALPPTPDTSPAGGVSSVSASPVADTRRPFTPPSVPYDQLRDVKVTDPLQMLDMAYDEASGYGSDAGGGNVGNIWSGELHISSDDQGSDDDDDQDALRDAKVDRYVLQLRDYGLDIDMDNELGSGAFGSAYLGQYNEQIANIEGQKYLLGVTPGQGFAAKFVRFSSDTDLDTRLAHEVEKCTLKSLRHQNIVSYRLAVNLGHHLVLSRTALGYTGRDIISYDRMFLIMDLGDRGALDKFWWSDDFNGRLAVQFVGHLCSAMSYMQDIGVAHRDIHTGNVLVFSGAVAGQYAAKWSDFGDAVSRDVYRHWGVIIPADQMHAMMRRDTIALANMIKQLMQMAANFDPPDPRVQRQVMALVADMSEAMEPLGDVLKRYTFTRF